jgi:hypothetical protein
MYMHLEITPNNSYSSKLNGSPAILHNLKPYDCMLVLMPEGKIVIDIFPSSTRKSTNPTTTLVKYTLYCIIDLLILFQRKSKGTHKGKTLTMVIIRRKAPPE